MAVQTAALVQLYPTEPSLIAADSGQLFGIVAPSSGPVATVLRISGDGLLTRRTLEDPVAPYFSHIDATGPSLLLGTAVVRRFTTAADELLRIDEVTLAVIERRTIPGGVVGIVADEGDVWIALADRVLRLDPSSLETRASFAVPGAVPPPAGSKAVASIALGRGSLWVAYGDAAGGTLYRLDPTTLSVSGQTALSGVGAVGTVVGDATSVWVVGDAWVRRVEATGVIADPIAVPGVQAVAARGMGLVALVDDGSADEALIQLGAQGGVEGSTRVGDAGGHLALDGPDVWLPQGLALAHWSLLLPQP